VIVLNTERLVVRHISASDSAFILNLMNEPSYLKFIGDRNIRSEESAREYIQSKFVQSYNENGFGLYLVELKESRIPIGICGLVKRPRLNNPDIGFAFLPEYWGKGYALESCREIVKYARSLKHKKLLAITSLNNEASIKLLEKLGMKFAMHIKLSDDNNDETKLFCLDLES
jgi:[ribosomal protein S5]-alanine N-acetyltransferase